MSDRDFTITINGSLQASPLQTPDPNLPNPPKMDPEDSIIFDAAVPCRICFTPKDVFGSHIRLHQGINGGYTPAKVNTPYTLHFEILPIGTRCRDDMKIKTYSIKVG